MLNIWCLEDYVPSDALVCFLCKQLKLSRKLGSLVLSGDSWAEFVKSCERGVVYYLCAAPNENPKSLVCCRRLVVPIHTEMLFSAIACEVF